MAAWRWHNRGIMAHRGASRKRRNRSVIENGGIMARRINRRRRQQVSSRMRRALAHMKMAA